MYGIRVLMREINLPFIVKSVVLVIAYLVAAKIGLVFGTVSSSATIFWPPGGIALAALLFGGVRYLPPVFVAAYLTAEIVNAPTIFALGFSVGKYTRNLHSVFTCCSALAISICR